jgi:hypothetical protein
VPQDACLCRHGRSSELEEKRSIIESNEEGKEFTAPYRPLLRRSKDSGKITVLA